MIAAVALKTCTRCRVEKPVDAFVRNGRAKDGRYPYCKDCKYEMYGQPEHRKAKRRRGITMADTVTNKQCRRCDAVKPRAEFPNSAATNDGLFPWCKACNAAHQRSRYTTEEGHRSKLARYGLTIEDYDALLAAQHGVCAVCAGQNVQIDNRTGRARRFHVDHDHESGVVRGLLCGRCNSALGMADDDPARLRALADYLERP